MRAAALLALLSGLAAAWTRRDPCPTEIRVTIPNPQASYIGIVSRFHYYNGGIWYPGRYEPPRGSLFTTVSEVHDCLVACRANVTALDLRVALMGCSEWPDRWNLPFDLAGTDEFPALEELSLEGYDFREQEWYRVAPKKGYQSSEWLIDRATLLFSDAIKSYFKWFFLPDAQRLKTNLELWLDAMDFSKLRTLTLKDDGTTKMSGDALVKRLPEALKGLTSLTITGSWRRRRDGEDAGWPARDFILNLSPEASLAHLSWVDGSMCDDDVVEAVLQRHGSSLTGLEWRNSEAVVSERPVFSVDQLRRLSSLAPNLKSLSIDMNRKKNAWPERDLEALAGSLPRLTNLTIYWELQSDCRRAAASKDPYMVGGCDEACNGPDQLAAPRLDETSGEALFHLLRRAKTGEELTSVTFRAGDFSRPWDGPIYFPEWLEGRKVWVECSVLREDGSRKGEGEAVCRGEDQSLNESDEMWMARCGSDRTCKPKMNIIEAKKRAAQRRDADACWKW